MAAEDSVLDALALLVRSSDDLGDAAEHVVELARSNLKCDLAGITLRGSDGHLQSLAVTDPLVGEADRLQYELGEGPCVDAMTEQRDFACEDLSSDPRWPRWGPAAAALGLTSLLAARMTTADEPFGALNLYARHPRRFTHGDVDLAHVFAHQAALALTGVRRVEQLRVAVDGRTVIGQAQGMLMERFGLSPQQAFSVLRRYSQDHNIRLRAVAEELVQTGSLEPAPKVATPKQHRPR